MHFALYFWVSMFTLQLYRYICMKDETYKGTFSGTGMVILV